MAATLFGLAPLSSLLSENSWFLPGNHLHPAARHDYIRIGFWRRDTTASACPAAFVYGR